jgi:uncharacterized membrane protein (UPF0182 family)
MLATMSLSPVFMSCVFFVFVVVGIVYNLNWLRAILFSLGGGSKAYASSTMPYKAFFTFVLPLVASFLLLAIFRCV